MKVVSALRRASVEKRSKTSKYTRRKGRLYVIDKKNPKFKKREP